MIKLVVIDDAQHTSVHSFDRQTIVIGAMHSAAADLKLREENLDDCHFEISSNPQDPESFFISNLVHDPFLTLNGLSFGKRPLHHDDLIQIGKITIRFEIDRTSENNTSETNPDDLPLTIQEPALHEENELKESSGTDNPQTQPSNPPTFVKAVSTHKASLKDYYLSEYDDKGETAGKNQQMAPETVRKWHLFFKIAASFLGVMLIAAALTYLWVSDQSGEEEIMASKGVSDVAMALTYAQVKHIHPKNQNWSDPEFIKKNLTAVLAPEFTSWAELDKFGQFASCPYIMRIYTSHDLSHFLVIAQPVPSLLHWLVPKATIMIDSKTMEMRKIHDLKMLNRLLISTAIDGANSGEITSLLHQGELIALTHLNDKKDNQGFSPPKALALIRPGSENRIYNAPRYYAFGQSWLKRALELVEKTTNSNEVALFQQELAQLNKLPNFILYSSEGLHHATQSQKILSMLVPKEKFLIAYLQMSSKGKITGAHLLMDDITTEVGILEPRSVNSQEKEIVSDRQHEHTPSQHIRENSPQEEINLATSYGIDHDDPLFLRISALISARFQALKPLNDALIALINKHTQKLQADFDSQLALLQDKYAQADEEQRKKLAKELGAIIRDNSNLPAARLLDFIKASELNASLQDYLNTVQQQGLVAMPLKTQMEEQIKEIEMSANLQDLEQKAVQIASKLNFESIPDEEILISYQNSARSKVIQKLNEFLLSSDHALSQEAFSPECRQMLTHILESAWIIDPDSYDFYISEFELRTTPVAHPEG